MPNNISLKENESIEVTFKYGNVTRAKSKKDDSYYYVFDCEEGRINANEVLAEMIAANWCGRGGTMRIEKLNKTRFEIEIIDPAERIYDLEMREWDDSINGFAEVDFEIIGRQPAQSASKPSGEAKSPKPTTPAKSGDQPTLDGYASLMARCLQLAAAMCSEEVTEQQQKIAVTLFMQAERKGLTYEASETADTPTYDSEEDKSYEEETQEESGEEADDGLPF
tara:strand:- start:1245 stop:1913 length:669 start_codon:yes stop_codon:yes gene_type:complete